MHKCLEARHIQLRFTESFFGTGKTHCHAALSVGADDNIPTRFEPDFQEQSGFQPLCLIEVMQFPQHFF